MEQVRAGLEGVVCYLDDIIITGCNDNERLLHLQIVLQRFQEYSFRLKRQKCNFFKEEVEHLGQVVFAEGFRSSGKKVPALLQMPVPQNIGELRVFLGPVQYYGWYVKALSDLCAPLTRLSWNDVRLEWSTACARAFNEYQIMAGVDRVASAF